MHELSVARGILEIVSEAVPRDQLKNVRAVRVDVGEAAGVSFESLEFSFGAIIRDTPLAHATLTLRRVPLLIRCNHCQAISGVEVGTILCPRCNSSLTSVMSGNELQVVNLDLLEETS